MTDPVEKIAAAVLYEGYVLWPYRRSAQKNQKRWTFGGVYPRAFSETAQTNDPWLMQTQCLVVGEKAAVEVKLRFLHVVERKVAAIRGVGEELTEAERLEFVDELRVGGERYLAWEEAAEREVVVSGLGLADLKTPTRAAISIPAGVEEEPLAGDGGVVVGALVRSWHSLEGVVEVEAEPVCEGLFTLTVKITNTAPWDGQDRDETLRQTFVSTHTILRVEDGEFVSLMDPPEEMKRLAEECENKKTWPVLAGEEGDRHTILSSPIILYDYPKIAPESPGDLFDGGEIDQLLTLSILSLTDEEKEEARATDPRAREILDRSESLSEEDLMSLHGAIRGFQTLRGGGQIDPFEVEGLERPAPISVTVDGVEIRSGSRVRLWPRAGRDIFDIALSGKAAIVDKIEQDFEDRILLSVSVEDDPGREMVDMPVLGHRFFFSPEEVEPLEAQT
ncbi:MAG TPA: hypothetical protein VI027_07605 [Rubrobacteraceae bacterium]